MKKSIKLFFSLLFIMFLISLQLNGQSGSVELVTTDKDQTGQSVSMEAGIIDKKKTGQSDATEGDRPYKKTTGQSGLMGAVISDKNKTAQTGSIEGIITDKKNQETLIGTNVVIDGTTKGTITDFNGYFLLPNLDPGVYSLRISYVSYEPVVLENIKVEPNKATKIDVTLQESAVGLGEVSITAVRRSNTENAVLIDIKTSPFVSIGVSAQQISRTLDKDASEVVKRIPGITIIDDRFLIVRGLSQRYNNVWLNNASTPSSEADVKAFSFDVIPSSMIENIMIFKSPAAEFPADFSGGFVKISTKNMPDRNGLFMTYSSAINQGTTFNTFYKNQGSSTDWLGFDNGFRALPRDMPTHLNQYESATNPLIRDKITQLGRELNENWTVSPATAYPDQKLLLGNNLRVNIGQGILGNTTALSYSLSNNYDKIINNEYSIYNFTNDKPTYVNQFIDDQYTKSARLSLMHNWSFIFGNGNKIEFRNLFNQIGTTRSTLRTGRDWYNDGRYIKSNELRNVTRSIYTGQISGTHSINNGVTKLEWIAGYSASNKNEPDTKRFRYIRNEQDTSNYVLLFLDQPDLSSVSRTWISLNENILSTAINFTHKFTFSDFRPELKSGFYFENKNRDFNARNFGYAKGSNQSIFDKTTLAIDDIFNENNINLTDGIKLAEITSLSDSYSASNRQFAGYLSFKLPITSKINFYPGFRIESNDQNLFGYMQGTTQAVNVNRDTLNIFPSANMTYNFTEKSLLRFAYGMTVNRPEFREIAPFYFVDFDLNAGIYGNPELRQAYIQNFDIRYELYPASGENFNLGMFYKKFKDPIEQVILGNSPSQFSFENVKSAYSFGVESEIRKSLGFINGLENFTIVSNLTLIKSKVQFNHGDLTRDRPLEGQSPFIINTGLYYQNDDKGLMFSLLYNVIGKRIVAVGRPSPNQWEDIPNIYEIPRNVVDLTFSKKIGNRIEIKGGVKDLLNERIEYVQTFNVLVDLNSYTNGLETGMRNFDRSQVTRSYLPGRYFIIGLALNFGK